MKEASVSGTVTLPSGDYPDDWNVIVGLRAVWSDETDDDGDQVPCDLDDPSWADDCTVDISDTASASVGDGLDSFTGAYTIDQVDPGSYVAVVEPDSAGDAVPGKSSLANFQTRFWSDDPDLGGAGATVPADAVPFAVADTDVAGKGLRGPARLYGSPARSMCRRASSRSGGPASGWSRSRSGPTRRSSR